ncbi:asparagine synthetase B [Candidatus Poribacteria bacterium]|nr:asparagine synthetase B [Candidatus Poribacteria bacterium]
MKTLTKITTLIILTLIFTSSAFAQWLLIPMDKQQTNHLKAYGLTYWTLQAPREYRAQWLLNYRCGSFLLVDQQEVRQRALAMEVYFEPISDAEWATIKQEIDNSNMDAILLEKAPKVAVYAPPENSPYRDPWDDAVKLALNYAEIPYTNLWDKEVLAGELETRGYDWLHLHHEDFTGQYGKFYGVYKSAVWYQQQVRLFEQAAEEAGYDTVPKHKAAVAQAIQDYVVRGGFLFAMCSAPDTLDISLSTKGGEVDIVAPELDGTPIDSNYRSKLDFKRTFAFENFVLETNPNVYEFSNIDNPEPSLNPLTGEEDFVLFEFAAKHDPIPTMLTQDHVGKVRGFLGQTTSFNKKTIRDTVTILGDIEGSNYAKYIHGKFGKGTFTFLGGHDPEDYRHTVGEGDAPTDLDLHKDSPGYRLILNNVLFPAAKKKPQKT